VTVNLNYDGFAIAFVVSSFTRKANVQSNDDRSGRGATILVWTPDRFIQLLGLQRYQFTKQGPAIL